MLNRGRGGEEASEELSRFENDVFGEEPSLVIWQVGTNAVFHKGVHHLDEVIKAIEVGLDWLKGFAMDVVLIDLQYVHRHRGKERRSETFRNAGRADFRGRGKSGGQCVPALGADAALVSTTNIVSMADMIDPADGKKLHKSDWGTNCVTEALYDAIAGAPAAAV